MNIEEIYSLYVNDVYNYLYSLCKDKNKAEDLMQDTFYKAHVSLMSRDIQDIKPWLFKVAYYTYIDSIRKEKREVIKDDIDIVNYKTPEDITVDNSSYQTLLNLLDRLLPNEKHAILLCDIQDCTYEQASVILDLKINTLKSHLYRGRNKMREFIKKEKKNNG
ncbi:RNA polymerase subunit sigma [Alkalihalobacillus trypoxylicola]|uniref:RNA polymerase subunit sigma n=1 Tax=Alkalihalobacillus trypoxylicola TaxID=519424 RepID=A0A161PJ76_9BACI|nr:RNA polymerase subunit sigma [Alkalihalobacillus trypoxylicola]